MYVCAFFNVVNGNKHTRDKIQHSTLKIGKILATPYERQCKETTKIISMFGRLFQMRQKNNATFRLHFEWNSFYVFTLFTVVLFPILRVAKQHSPTMRLSHRCTWKLCYFLPQFSLRFVHVDVFTFWYFDLKYEFDDNKHKNAIKRYTFIASLSAQLYLWLLSMY